MGGALLKGVFFLALLLFFLLSLTGIDRSCLDAADSAYVISADAVSRGLMPYRDFLAAHPPLLFVIGAPLAKLGAGVLPFRLFSVLVVAVTGLLAWRLTMRVTGDDRKAFLAGAFTLFAPLGLFFSRLFLNDALVSLMAVAAVMLLLKSSRAAVALAGVICVLGSLTKLTFLPFTAAFLVYLLIIRSGRKALLFAAIAIGGSLVAAGAVQTLSGGAYMSDILVSQTSKSLSLTNFTEALERLWRWDWPLIVAAVPGIWFACRELRPVTGDTGRTRLLVLLWLIATLPGLLTLPASGHDINLFQPAEPALALFAAWGLVGLADRRSPAALVAIGVFLLLAVPGWVSRDRDFLYRSNSGDTAAIAIAIAAGSGECQPVLAPGCYALEAGRPVTREYLDPFLWEEKYRRGDAEALSMMDALRQEVTTGKPGPVVLVPGTLTAELLEPALKERYSTSFTSSSWPPATLWLPVAGQEGG